MWQSKHKFCPCIETLWQSEVSLQLFGKKKILNLKSGFNSGFGYVPWDPLKALPSILNTAEDQTKWMVSKTLPPMKFAVSFSYIS